MAFSSALRCSTSSRAMRSSATALKSRRRWDLARPVISTGDGGAGLLTCWPLSFVMARTRPTARAGDDDVALMQGAVLDQQRGHGAAALVQTGLDDGALAARLGLALSSHLGGQVTISSRLSMPMPVLAEIVHTMVSPPHSSGTSRTR